MSNRPPQTPQTAYEYPHPYQINPGQQPGAVATSVYEPLPVEQSEPVEPVLSHPMPHVAYTVPAKFLEETAADPLTELPPPKPKLDLSTDYKPERGHRRAARRRETAESRTQFDAQRRAKTASVMQPEVKERGPGFLARHPKLARRAGRIATIALAIPAADHAAEFIDDVRTPHVIEQQIKAAEGAEIRAQRHYDSALDKDRTEARQQRDNATATKQQLIDQRPATEKLAADSAPRHFGAAVGLGYLAGLTVSPLIPKKQRQPNQPPRQTR